LGLSHFDPDEAARSILVANPGITQELANSTAWHEGKRLLEFAIARRLDFAFETTLGGQTITLLLERALDEGIEVRVSYVGLSSPELHIARVRRRVEAGGHDIPTNKIRERYDNSRLNLIRLLPRLTELSLYDNSAEADPDTGAVPEPQLILHVSGRKVVGVNDLTRTPDWAKPIVAAALRISR
jgi:predicted ABC-type ATPase